MLYFNNIKDLEAWYRGIVFLTLLKTNWFYKYCVIGNHSKKCGIFNTFLDTEHCYKSPCQSVSWLVSFVKWISYYYLNSTSNFKWNHIVPRWNYVDSSKLINKNYFPNLSSKVCNKTLVKQFLSSFHHIYCEPRRKSVGNKKIRALCPTRARRHAAAQWMKNRGKTKKEKEYT